MGFIQLDESLDIIHDLDIPDTVEKTMVMLTSSAENSIRYPMVALYMKLLERSSAGQKTSTHKKTVSSFFYSSLYWAMWPENLLKCFKTALLHTLFTKFQQRSVENAFKIKLYVLQLIMDPLWMAHFSLMRVTYFMKFIRNGMPRQLVSRFSLFLHHYLKISELTMEIQITILTYQYYFRR